MVSEPQFVLWDCVKKIIMARRRQQRLDDVYDREIEQQRLDQRMDERFERMMEQMTERMTALLANQNRNNLPPQNRHDFVENFDEGSVDEEIEVPHRRRRDGADEDRRRWETGMRTEISEFHGSLQPEEFLDWLATVEEILDFKGVPENKRVPLIATRLRGRATTWWQQTKLTRNRLGK